MDINDVFYLYFPDIRNVCAERGVYLFFCEPKLGPKTPDSEYDLLDKYPRSLVQYVDGYGSFWVAVYKNNKKFVRILMFASELRRCRMRVRKIYGAIECLFNYVQVCPATFKSMKCTKCSGSGTYDVIGDGLVIGNCPWCGGIGSVDASFSVDRDLNDVIFGGDDNIMS
jgi:hypothetical protein